MKTLSIDIEFLSLPVLCVVLYISFTPSSQTPILEFGVIPINFKEIVIIFASLFYSLAYIYGKLYLKAKVSRSNHNKKSRYSKFSSSLWHKSLPISTILICVYALITIDPNKIGYQNAWAMAYTVILALCLCLLAFTCISLLRNKGNTTVKQFLWSLTILLALTGLIYTILTYFSIGIGGIRQTENAIANAVGIGRVTGPLFGAANGYFCLIPALTFASQDFFDYPHVNPKFKLLVICLLLLTILATGSRGALLSISLFIVTTSIYFLFRENLKRMFSFLIVTFLIISIFATTAFSISERVAYRITTNASSSSEGFRQRIHVVALRTVESRDIASNLLGSGYGSIWPWYIPYLPKGSSRGEFPLTINHHGTMLLDPHSTFLVLAVELGLPGIAYFTFLLITIMKMLINSFKERKLIILNSGIFCVCTAMFFGLFLFKIVFPSMLWWIYCFGSLSLMSRIPTNKHEQAP